MPVIAHVEIRVPLCQDIPDTGSHHPAVLVREVGELLKDGPADRGQVGLRGAGIPPGGRCSGSFIGIGIRRLGGFPDFIYKFEFFSPIPMTSMPASRRRAARRVKSLSEDTRQNPSTRPVYRMSIASIISAESVEFFPVV